jgi:hypothetical protein
MFSPQTEQPPTGTKGQSIPEEDALCVEGTDVLGAAKTGLWKIGAMKGAPSVSPPPFFILEPLSFLSFFIMGSSTIEAGGEGPMLLPSSSSSPPISGIEGFVIVKLLLLVIFLVPMLPLSSSPSCIIPLRTLSPRLFPRTDAWTLI